MYLKASSAEYRVVVSVWCSLGRSLLSSVQVFIGVKSSSGDSISGIRTNCHSCGSSSSSDSSSSSKNSIRGCSGCYSSRSGYGSSSSSGGSSSGFVGGCGGDRTDVESGWRIEEFERQGTTAGQPQTFLA